MINIGPISEPEIPGSIPGNRKKWNKCFHSPLGQRTEPEIPGSIPGKWASPKKKSNVNLFCKTVLTKCSLINISEPEIPGSIPGRNR